MEVMAPEKTNALTIYWDGQCPFCSAVKSRILAFDTNHALNFVDMKEPEVALSAASRFSPAELNEEMRLRMPDGTWRTGFFAVAEIFRALPSLDWLGNLMQIWFLADIGPKAYRWFAKNRYTISRILGLPTPCDESGSCRIN